MKAKARYRIRWPRLILAVGLLLLGAGLLMSAAFYGFFRFGSYEEVAATTPQAGTGAPAAADQEADRRHTILVMGTDAEGGRSDTMIVVAVDKATQRVGALWIPRDTRAFIPGNNEEGKPYGWDKINAANAYWTEDMTGHQRAMQAVADLLGVRIDDFVQVRLKDFERIVDTLGGVDINVPFAMDYDDPYQDFHVHLQKGVQHLNGEQALGFVRWRHNNDETVAYEQGDIGRIKTQQVFAEALLKQMLQTRTIAKLPSLVPQLSRGVKTSLDLGQMLELARLAQGINLDAVVAASLPGHDAYISGGSYWIVDEEKARQVVDWVIRGKGKPDFVSDQGPRVGAISVTAPRKPVPGEAEAGAGKSGTGGSSSGASTQEKGGTSKPGAVVPKTGTPPSTGSGTAGEAPASGGADANTIIQDLLLNP